MFCQEVMGTLTCRRGGCVAPNEKAGGECFDPGVPIASVLVGGPSSSSEPSTASMARLREDVSIAVQDSHLHQSGCFRDLLLLSVVHFLW